jgi:hypothetical protein
MREQQQLYKVITATYERRNLSFHQTQSIFQYWYFRMIKIKEQYVCGFVATRWQYPLWLPSDDVLEIRPAFPAAHHGAAKYWYIVFKTVLVPNYAMLWQENKTDAAMLCWPFCQASTCILFTKSGMHGALLSYACMSRCWSYQSTALVDLQTEISVAPACKK